MVPSTLRLNFCLTFVTYRYFADRGCRNRAKRTVSIIISSTDRRQQMERDIDDGLFVEFGEYKGNLYGTANRNIKEIIELGYTCILNPHHQVLDN